MGKKRGDNFFVRHKRDLIWLGIILIIIIIIAALIFFMNSQKNPFQNSNSDNDAEKFKYSGESDDLGNERSNNYSDANGTNVLGNGSGGGGSGGGTQNGTSVTGNVSGLTNGTSVTENSTGNVSITLLPDTPLPYISPILENNNQIINFTYGRTAYSLKVWWIGDDDGIIFVDGVKSELRRGDILVPKISHSHGENENGSLEIGQINFFDTNLDGGADVKMRIIYTGGPSGHFKVKIYGNALVEICDDGVDNDGNGLKDCHESDCDSALAVRPCNYFEAICKVCEWHEEMTCDDDFDNDGDSFLDVDDEDCIGLRCLWNGTVGFDVIWSWLPEESPEMTPARRGCCDNSMACVNVSGACIPYDTYYETEAGNANSICGDNNNWDRCGSVSGGSQINKYPGNLSDGGDCVCALAWGEYYWICGMS